MTNKKSNLKNKKSSNEDNPLLFKVSRNSKKAIDNSDFEENL